MNDTLLVSSFEGFTDVPANMENLFNRNRTTLNALSESLAFDQLEHEKSCTFRFLEIVDRSDIGVVQGCENFGLSLKPAHPICVARELIGQDFDRNVALQFRIARTIHLTHSALTEKGRNFERTKSCTYIYRHWKFNRDADFFYG